MWGAGAGATRIFQDRVRGTITKSRLEDADGQFIDW